MNPEEMAKAIRKELNAFAKIESRELKTITTKAAAVGVKELKTTSPKRSGFYREHWTRKTTVNKSDRTGIVIHNKARYNITHLLEDGHEGVAHGMRYGRVRAIPHIKKAEDKVVDYIEKEIGKRL